jgi:hypothetical protein
MIIPPPARLVAHHSKDGWCIRLAGNGIDGLGVLAGWEGLILRSYSKALEAIAWIESGGSYTDWMQHRQDRL